MINTVYRLVAPRRFEIAFEDIDMFGENAIVRPTNLSICNADMRYYLGTRDAKVLAEKLPMALIHEGVGKVVADPTGSAFSVSAMKNLLISLLLTKPTRPRKCPKVFQWTMLLSA